MWAADYSGEEIIVSHSDDEKRGEVSTIECMLDGDCACDPTSTRLAAPLRAMVR